jgi:hypothetical protein
MGVHTHTGKCIESACLPQQLGGAKGLKASREDSEGHRQGVNSLGEAGISQREEAGRADLGRDVRAVRAKVLREGRDAGHCPSSLDPSKLTPKAPPTIGTVPGAGVKAGEEQTPPFGHTALLRPFLEVGSCP